MEGGIAGTGRADLQDSLPRPSVAANPRNGTTSHFTAAAELVEDQIEGSLLGLANPEIGRLIEGLEQARLAVDPTILSGLVRTAVEAAWSQDVPRALSAITELVRRDPEHGAQLIREAALPNTMHTEVNDVLQKLAASAKSNAEHVLAQASVAIENTPRSAAGAELLALAQRFLDTGQHINFVRAAEVGQAILAYFPVEAAKASPRVGARKGPETRQSFFGVWGFVGLGLLLLALAAWFVLSRG